MTENRRARPMSREDRRAAIVAATVPLLEQHGASVTTRQIAEAAGVAEGTLFKAFEDKRELLMTAAARVFDIGAAVTALEALPPAATLSEEVTAAAELLSEAARRIRRTMIAVHALAVADAHREQRPPGPPHPPPARDAHTRAVEDLIDALSRRFDPFRDDLRTSPEVLARLLLSAVSGRVSPATTEIDFTADQLVDVLLHGALA